MGDGPEWFYLTDGERRGPMSEGALRAQIRNGVLPNSVLVWTVGMAEWEPADIVLPRYISVSEDASAPELLYYPVSTLKFGVMCLVTFTLYDIWWLYKNWLFIKQRDGLRIMPFWRAWFAIFFTHDLFSRIHTDAEARGVGFAWKPSTIGFLLLIYLPGFLPDPLPLLSLLSFVPALPVVDAIGKMNSGTGVGSTSTTFSAGDIVVLVIGCGLWALLILGFFVA